MPHAVDVKTFQGLIAALNEYWGAQGCVIMQPLDMEVGAGTFHTASFLGAIGPEPWRAAFVQPSRRPTDGRYGENPNRVQRHHQYQVIIKPSPLELQELYLGSLRALKIDTRTVDIRFVEDNWESPTLGAWGLGWEVWLNGMEVTQFTYFQQVGGLECKPVTGEITYGLERLAMALQGVDNIYDLVWSRGPQGTVTYGDVCRQTEVEMSKYNFETADVKTLFEHFQFYEQESLRLTEAGLPLPAYELVLKASHTFNLLDARHALSVTERQQHILKIRRLAKAVAESYYQSREAQGFPLLKGQVETSVPTLKAASMPSLPAVDDCLIEILTEELPPKSLRQLSEVFKQEIQQRLSKAEFTFKQVDAFATPRRLAVLIKKLSSTSKEQTLERKGPALNAAYDVQGNPTPACVGFAKSCGVTPDQLRRVETAQGSWLAYTQHVPGKSIIDCLPTMVEQAAQALPIAKRMRWGVADTQFVRPVHGIVLMFADQVIPGKVLGCQSSNATVGHRFHANKTLMIANAGAYAKTLSRGRVIADFDKRREMIKTLAQACVKEHLGEDAQVYIDSDAFLDEVTGLVERPVALCGKFDAQFLTVPTEVLISAMQDHQRYFPVKDTSGKLLPYFIFISNIDSKDPAQVVQGNERVLRARLSDAAFFYNVDQQRSLEQRVQDLKSIVYHAKLGSLFDKSERLRQLADSVAKKLQQASLNIDANVCQRAAVLAKADLTTQMVNEFPELQGVMGGYYARHDGEPEAVAQAISEQYRPRYAGDQLPASLPGQVLSLVDRIDTLVGTFGINQLPTGDKDPYGLRRAALGVLRTLVEKHIHLDLRELLSTAVGLYQGLLTNAEVVPQVLNFMQERLRAWYLEQGVAADVFAAVAAVGITDPLDAHRRIQAVQAFKQLNEAEALSVANKRVSNILAKYETAIDATAIDPAMLVTPAEKNLASQIELKRQTLAKLYQSREYDKVLLQLADLRQPVDEFFDQVMVMAEDKPTRENRLLLLTQLRALFLQVADIALLQ